MRKPPLLTTHIAIRELIRLVLKDDPLPLGGRTITATATFPGILLTASLGEFQEQVLRKLEWAPSPFSMRDVVRDEVLPFARAVVRPWADGGEDHITAVVVDLLGGSPDTVRWVFYVDREQAPEFREPIMLGWLNLPEAA